MNFINPELAPSNMYATMCTKLSMEFDQDKTGSLYRMKDVYFENRMGGQHDQILGKLFLAEST